MEIDKRIRGKIGYIGEKLLNFLKEIEESFIIQSFFNIFKNIKNI